MPDQDKDPIKAARLEGYREAQGEVLYLAAMEKNPARATIIRDIYAHLKNKTPS